MKKTADLKEKYKAENLFQGSYASVVYLPKVDLLNQLSLDPTALNQQLKEVQELRKQHSDIPKKWDYSDITIKVPSPPPPSDAMVNPRTKKTFPLGTRRDPDTGEELKKVDSVMRERSIRNQIVYTDPANGLVYYVDRAGMIDSYTLGHLVELSENRNLILSILDSKIEVKDNYKTPSGLRQTWKSSRLEELFYVDPKDQSQDANSRRERLRSVSNVDTDSDGGVPLFMYAKHPEFREYVHSRLREIEFSAKEGLLDLKKGILGEEYAKYIVAVLYADKHKEYFEKLVDEENQALAVDPNSAPEIPHVKEDTRFLPHQSYALSFLKGRKVAMVDADPGAGKTLILLCDILDKMNTAGVRRPCIVMPNSLLSDQKAELEQWTKGTINFIVINTDTVRESDPNAERASRGTRRGLPKKGDKLAGLKALTKLIREAPRNTILMTSYEWLRGGTKDRIKTASGVRYRNPSWLLTSIGVDMLVCDESHAIRINSSGEVSGRAEALLQMSSLVPYKRCYTGTATPGSPDDVYLQMSFLDPSVLGGREQFLKKFALSTNRSGKVEEFKPGAIKQLRELISKRVGVSIRRSAWLNELPELKVSYHKAILSGTQRIVYERLLDRIIKEELLGELEPGTVGLELQRAMRDKYASNPTARDQLSQWQRPNVVSLPEYDDQTNEYIETDYDLPEEGQGAKFDLSDKSRIEAFKQAQARIAQHWRNYEALQGESEDVPDADDFKPLLTKFIAIDKFLNNPTADEFGKFFLVEDEDKQSPKIKVIDQILDRHFSDPNNGKVIIFTHYRDVARHVFESIKLAGRAVYYDASETKALARFKRDPGVQILIAVEQSIQEGQNLQVANRIIRLDLPWNPGQYEQSIARAYRLPPKDPDAARYSTVHVDLVLCEGTAELTKLSRMVSKMHAVRQFISGYTSDNRFPLVGMSKSNMDRYSTFASAQPYIDAFGEMRAYEKEEAKLAPKVFGTETRTLANGTELEGSEKIETPIVESDLSKGPWTVKPSKVSKGVIHPKLIYYNGGYWLTLEYLDGMKFILKDFEKMETDSLLSMIFRTPKEAFEILASLREKGIHVVNQQELYAKITGEIAIDPAFPQSKIDYQKLVRTAAALPRLTDEATAKQILAYSPSQDNLAAARQLLTKAASELFGEKDVADLHVLAAAKTLGLLGVDLKTVDLKDFYKQTKRFIIFAQNKKILQDQLAAIGAPASKAPAAPAAPQPSPSEEESSIPGLDVAPPPTGIPVQLEVAISGRLRAGKLISSPCFVISSSSAFLDRALAGQAIKLLEGAGFRMTREGERLRWLFLGETRVGAKAKLSDFARLVYIWYTLGNPDEFIGMMRDIGFTEAEIEEVFPRAELTAMLKISSWLNSFPEFDELTKSIFS